ncbi:TerB family tellurite resistance protein [Flagellatimonas centrodinii]|uniref:tellurite resistance TerB family protein n=1 Tax=Flagellatimonas centrodinii TaxID=2806210 RepID=UPI001FF03758|nr:TerB family tellurite resistance protein [Flagellatimonas centrodinii]ULQ46796.1 TerB family tellurite resistance protein [Flagellatimonas centrodinii]
MMLSKVWQRLRSELHNEASPPSESAQQQAIAVLLHEVAHADFHHAQVEIDQLLRELGEAFSLAPAAAEQLRRDAAETAEGTASLHRLIDTLNATLDADGKRALLARLWRVALADEVLDPHEEALIRKLSDLLFVPHAVFVQERLRALGEPL